MSWVRSDRSSSKRDATTVKSPRKDLLGEIHIKRKMVANLRNDVPRLLRKLLSIEVQMHACTKRHHIRRRRNLEIQYDDLRERIADIKSGSLERSFELRALPYVTALAVADKEVTRRSTSQARSRVLAMGARSRRRKPRDSRQVRVKPSSKTASGTITEAILSDEYFQAFDGVAPPLYLVSGDQCPFCGPEGQMRTISSQMACSKCGRATSVIDTSSECMGYGEVRPAPRVCAEGPRTYNAYCLSQDVEYASFNYKRANHFR